MKTLLKGNRALFLAVAALLLAITFGMTSCNATGNSPIAGFDNTSTNALSTDISLETILASYSSTPNEMLNDVNTEDLSETMGIGGGAVLGDNLLGAPPRAGNPQGGNPRPSTTGTTTPETRPEAILEISRRPIGQDRATAGGFSSARFSGSLGVVGVSVSVLGNTYAFTALTQRPGNSNSPNGRPNSTNANAQRPQESAFVYPAPPSGGAAPTPIPLTDANALATFRVNSYTLQDNAIDIPGKISVTSIQENASLPRTAPLTVNWTLAGTFTSGQIMLRNVLDSSALAGKTREEVRRIVSNLPRPVTKRFTAGTTSMTFTAAELASLQAGNVHLSIAVANVKRTNSDKAVLSAHSANGVFFRFQ
ncbi:MAG: hypothetical protein MUF71_21120 [Candidatus Kapabacteria bacterium]|jgi:hypothetical protein|nr:hypothetical protein [Candidatus Kapabacteria bacterium]